MKENRDILMDVLTRRRKAAVPRPPILSSAQAPWRGVRVEQFDGGPEAFAGFAPLDHMVLVQLEQPGARDWKRGGAADALPTPAGCVSFFPAMSPVTWGSHDSNGFLCVTLEPTFLLCAAHSLVRHDCLQLAECRAVEDPFVLGTALALRSEILAGYPGGRPYGELLANALAAHLVRKYSSASDGEKTPALGLSTAEVAGGLSPYQLRRAIDWMNEHLAEDAGIEQMAEEVGLSPFHFARLFKASTGYPPHQYRIRRRVERGKELLVTSTASIAQIAVQVGFCDQSHFASHFKRTYGITPKAFIRRFTAQGSEGDRTIPAATGLEACREPCPTT